MNNLVKLVDSPSPAAPEASVHALLARSRLRILVCLLALALAAGAAVPLAARADRWGLLGAGAIVVAFAIRTGYVIRDEFRRLRRSVADPLASLLEGVREGTNFRLDGRAGREAHLIAAGVDELRSNLRRALDNSEARQAESAYQAATLHRLLELSRDFTSSLELPHVLASVGAGARSLSGFPVVKVWLVDDKGLRLRLAHETLASNDPSAPRVLDLGEGPAGKAAKYGSTQRSTDADESVALAMIAGGKTLGVIELAPSPGRRAPKEIVTTLETLAGLAANAIEAALFYQETQRLSHTDSLTHLMNRRRLDEDLAMEVGRSARYSNPLSFVLFDVDNFKAFNDGHGHLEGDAILQEIAATLSSAMRTTDSSYRYGGEEFAILLRETTPEEATLVAERLRRRIENQFAHRFHIRITASFGIAALPDNAMTATELIRNADEALYRAKDAGRNRVEISSATPLTARDNIHPLAAGA